MGDNRRKELIEQYEDAALALLMDEYAEDEGERLLREFEEAEKNGEIPEIPPELDETCKRLIHNTFAKQERTTKVKKLGKIISKAAVFLLVFPGLSAATVLCVDALRVPVLNFILGQTDRYSSLTTDIKNNGEDFQSELADKMYNAPIPDSYDLILEEYYDDGSITICYQNQDGYVISFMCMHSMGILNIDTENAETTELELYDYHAFFTNKDGYHLVWIDSTLDIMYELYANGIDIDTFWTIAYTLAE